MDAVFSLSVGGAVPPHRVTDAEEAAHTLAVIAEDLLSTWFIQAVRQNSTPTMSELLRRIHEVSRRAAVDSAAQLGLDPNLYPVRVSVTIGGQKSHLSANHVEEVLNKSGQNLTFQDKKSWDQQAALYLADPYRQAAHLLTYDDWIILTYLRAIRNHIAHRSTMSLKVLNSMLRSVRVGSFSDLAWPGNRVVKRQAGNTAGDLLLTKTTGGETILARVFSETRTLVERLRVN
jgi:hypothetical protein